MERARWAWGQKPDEVWANVLKTRILHRRILDHAGDMEWVMDEAKALEWVLVEGVAGVAAEAGVTAAATGPV